MGSFSDKAKGAGNQVSGKIKQGVGKATDNDRLQAEGKLQEAQGDAQKARGKIKDALKQTIDRA